MTGVGNVISRPPRPCALMRWLGLLSCLCILLFTPAFAADTAPAFP